MSHKKPRFGSTSPINIQSVVQSNGEDALRVQVDYSKVPPPDPYYIADYTRIERTGSSVLLTLGKLDGVAGKTLRNKLEVVLPAYAFMGQWMGSLAFIRTLKEKREKKQYPAYDSLDVNETTDKVQTVHSNSMFISGAEGECCVDLYFLSPRDVRFFVERSDTPHLEPLVRIILDPGLLVHIGESFPAIAEELKQFAPPLEETTEIPEVNDAKLELHHS